MALKAIPKGNKGLSKLPKSVRNKMGYNKTGGERKRMGYASGGNVEMGKRKPGFNYGGGGSKPRKMKKYQSLGEIQANLIEQGVDPDALRAGRAKWEQTNNLNAGIDAGFGNYNGNTGLANKYEYDYNTPRTNALATQAYAVQPQGNGVPQIGMNTTPYSQQGNNMMSYNPQSQDLSRIEDRFARRTARKEGRDLMREMRQARRDDRREYRQDRRLDRKQDRQQRRLGRIEARGERQDARQANRNRRQANRLHRRYMR